MVRRRGWKEGYEEQQSGYRLTLHVGSARLFRSRPPFSTAYVCYAHR